MRRVLIGAIFALAMAGCATSTENLPNEEIAALQAAGRAGPTPDARAAMERFRSEQDPKCNTQGRPDAYLIIPSAVEFGSVYPAVAANAEVPGWAIVTLLVDAGGKATDLRLLATGPIPEFGDAGLALASRFVFVEAFVGCRVAVPINFRMPN